MKRFGLSLKLHKRSDKTLVEKCGYYIKDVIKKGTIIEGYAQSDESSETIMYYWVEDENGCIHDVGLGISEFAEKITLILTRTKPVGCEIGIDQVNHDMFIEYRDSPRVFWSRLSAK